jgi:hypothetical protein
MHFNKQTIRALIAIACVSVSANQLQAGFWDWFRCGKRTAPATTESTAAIATHSTSAAITLPTYAEEKEPFKESKEPKEPQQTQPVMVATYTGSIPAVATTSSAPATATATSMAAAATQTKRAPQTAHAEQKSPNIIVRILKFVWKHPILTLCGVAFCWQLLKLASPTTCNGIYVPGQGSDTLRCTPWVEPVNETTPLGGNRTDGSYSVNLMWINRNLNKTQTYICPDTSNQAYGSNPTYACLSGAFKWAKVSQGSVVNLWFDSALTPERAVNNTLTLIKEHKSTHPEWAQIKLRDIREIPTVATNPDIFSDKTAVYFRSDLLRPIIALHVLSNDEANYFVYSDLDIRAPLSQKQLFDNQTLQTLQPYGIVLASHSGYSHAFQIIGNHNHNLLKAMKFVIIELNIKRAYNALQGNFKTEWMAPSTAPTKALGDGVVFHNYDDMFEYYRFLEGNGQLLCGEKIYKSEYGLEPFELTYVHVGSLCTFKTNEDTYGSHVSIPTKDVDLPPMSGTYAF